MARRKQAVTLKDIAQESGVSHTTVSLVLRGVETGRISPATRERIMEAARRLHYVTDGARCPAAGPRTRTIGLLLSTLLNPFYAEIAQDIIDRARETGYSILTCTVREGVGAEDAALERDAAEQLLSKGVDGVIFCSVARHDLLPSELAERGIPLVLAMRNLAPSAGVPQFDHIGVHNERGAFMATEHLLRLGHRRIGLIAGSEEFSTGYDRKAGYLAALAAWGIAPVTALMVSGDWLRESGRAGARRLLSLPEPPTAILAGNDCMAIGVLDTLRELGLQAGKDVAVVGFDDIVMASLPGVDLTTVSQRKATMGRLAVDLLIERIRGISSHFAKSVLFDPILVVRESCGFTARGGVYPGDVPRAEATEPAKAAHQPP